jgi:hypothetical protein
MEQRVPPLTLGANPDAQMLAGELAPAKHVKNGARARRARRERPHD